MSEKEVLTSDGAPSLTRRFRFAFGIAFLVTTVAIGFAFVPDRSGTGARADGTGQVKRGGSSGEVPISTAVAVRGNLPLHLDGLGTVTAINTVTIRSRVDGELLRVHFTEGQPVHKGELLAEIDPRPFEAQLAQAEGQLARDEALLDNARADLQRYQTLLLQDSISNQQVAGQAALVRQYEAAARVDKGQIAAIKLQLAYCRITSPVDGRAGLRLVDPGNVVKTNDANGLVVISQTQPIAAVFTLSEEKLPQVMRQLNEGSKLSVDAYDRKGTNLLAVGSLLAVDNQIDVTTGTVKLKALFPNADGVLFANQFVNVRMNLSPHRDVVLIPSAAVQRGSQGEFAYVVGGKSKVRLQLLKLGPSEGQRVAVLEGLDPGDEVVIEGSDRLRDGQSVRVVAASASGTASGTLVSASEPVAQSEQRSTKSKEHRQ
ncbi:MdtA/MuxA family multidrug efflux RND transporter periplasmic adaptor subunit [Methyloterricola oryzae]|uniref:MdtA/MuxA family multidrug efflux RND transporter periplasmic adaptor subunit n=1 Tax=Methyloterricola oryzae TaxID=1495050 RepID=UPI0009E6335C|nr:MdtA/MuxA family multidrug efflux RND transporter periplasmic adaptor subunit [Methyloterricola oryzae]